MSLTFLRRLPVTGQHRALPLVQRAFSSAASYTAPIDDEANGVRRRLYGPDKEITPVSRKPVPTKIQTRNAAGPYEAEGRPLPYYPKRKSPFKRAAALLNALTSEEALRMIRDGRAKFAEQLPRPEPGQVLRVSYKNSTFKTSAPEKDEPAKKKGAKKQVANNQDDENANLLHFTGIVIASRQRMLGSTVILRNVVNGIAIERAFPLYSPLVKNVEVVGQKRVVRNKLYYLRDKPLRDSSVPNPLAPPPS